MDKFSISWEAYHELTQQDQALPRSYLEEGISKTPGDQPVAELPLEDLIKQEIQEHVSKK